MKVEIIVVENGFLVRENVDYNRISEHTWVFESTDSLAKFVRKWGNGKEKAMKGEK